MAKKIPPRCYIIAAQIARQEEDVLDRSDVEIEDNAKVRRASSPEGFIGVRGSWVQAWLWVADEEAEQACD